MRLRKPLCTRQQASRILLALPLLLLLAAKVGAATLTVVPSKSVVLPGESVDVAVVVSGLGDLSAPSLGTFDLNLLFDDALFMFNGLTFNTQLGDPSAAEAITGFTPGVGSLNAFEVSLLPPATLIAQQPGSFALYTATFEAIGVGHGRFDVQPAPVLGDELGNPITPVTLVGAFVGAGFSSPSIPTLSSSTLLFLFTVLLLVGLLGLRRVVR